MRQQIAIVGMACRYPDANSPAELWENVLAQRQAFRRIPSERLPLDEYYSPDASAPDRTYSRYAALLTDWEFDRAAFRVSRSTFESADLAHWLALDVAAAALRDSGLEPPRETTGVIIGNTLTGDSSRASSLRLRWPYVRRAIGDALTDDVLADVEQRFKASLAPVGEDTLAGGLSNTIAGRICNYFGFGGGGYTVDGACSSSLLAVIQACNALASGDLDVALAGGVDLSLDPFELVGFAKCSALARERMWVYDQKSNGFLPGEGCGFVVLMRHDDALESGRRVYATIPGWGMSSDGHGGMTRPEMSGQRRALQRAYAKAALDANSVTLFEGHGTGTPVGDPVELEAIASLLDGDREHYISSIKANIGHTKAAAGMAGLLKATLALERGVIPPITGCDEPRVAAPLCITQAALPWPAGVPRRAAVSAFGFGGINTHVVLESDSRAQGHVTPARRRSREVFLFAGDSEEDVRRQLALVASRAAELSLAELSDVAAAVCTSRGRWRASVIASTPEELEQGAASARVVHVSDAPRIAFLFSGQGSLPNVTTDLAQPAIVRASLDALRELHRHGIEADCAIGHSLGEITALFWSGALTEAQLLALSGFRGNTMQRLAADGAMAALACDERRARALCGDDAVIAAINAPMQLVVSGRAEAMRLVLGRARERGIGAMLVPVAAAFHSPAMAPAAAPLRDFVRALAPRPIERRIFSTVIGEWLAREADVAELLAAQLTHPVRFREAVDAVARDVELFIEVGPGSLLTNLASSFAGKPVVASERIGDCLAAAWTAGCDVDLSTLFTGRFTRPIDLARRPKFIASPCGVPPFLPGAVEGPVGEDVAPIPIPQPMPAMSSTFVLRQLVARQLDLAIEVVSPDARMLADLHLSSITVARILADAARELRVPMLVDPTSFANATIADAAAALESLRGREIVPDRRTPDGIADWLRPFVVVDVPIALPANRRKGDSRWRFEGIDWPAARERFAVVAGHGVVVVLPRSDASACIDSLLACRTIGDGERLVVVQEAACGSAVARTLHLERPAVSVRIVNIPRIDERAIDWIAAEAAAAGDFCEATYGEDGLRREPRLRLVDTERNSVALTADDVLLVTGGGKGIGFETALHLARTSGARLILVGRSVDDAELRANLARLELAQIRHDYVAADVTDIEAVRHAVARAGRITAILHAAGSNVPTPLDALDRGAFLATFAPKVEGLGNVLAAVDTRALRLVVTFGSVIARTGLRAEAHYAFANEWLARATSEFAAAHPNCRAVCIEWSAWSGLGMAARLDVVDSLRRGGVTPLAPEAAVRLAERIIASPTDRRVVVAGRLGDPPTIRFDTPTSPMFRFVDETRVHIAGVELVADARISMRSDPYAADHVFRGEPLFPAVMALEAMAQAASTVSGRRPSRIERIALRRPVTIPREGEMTIRIASLVREDGVDVVLRSSETQFAFDHFSARFSFDDALRPTIDLPGGDVDLDPSVVYARLLFHDGRFRRVRRYRELTATECVADLEGREDLWFHRYLSSSLLLGDPGLRDAAIHAIQACVPQAIVLPESIDAIDFFATANGDAVVVARETARDADGFVFDVDLATVEGLVLERWRGLRLHIVARRERLEGLPPALWVPLLEREIDGVRIRIAKNGATDDVVGQSIVRRADGKPFVREGHVSSSHDGDLTLVASGSRPVGCDLQFVNGHPWRDVLDPRDLALAGLAMEGAGDSAQFAGARIWSARESIKKLAGNALAPIVLDSCGARQRVTFTSGVTRIDTFAIGDYVVAIAREDRR